MKRPTQRQRELAYIERELGDKIICRACDVKLADYPLLCGQGKFPTGECAAAMAIDAAKAKFRAGQYGEER